MSQMIRCDSILLVGIRGIRERFPAQPVEIVTVTFLDHALVEFMLTVSGE